MDYQCALTSPMYVITSVESNKVKMEFYENVLRTRDNFK